MKENDKERPYAELSDVELFDKWEKNYDQCYRVEHVPDKIRNCYVDHDMWDDIVISYVMRKGETLDMEKEIIHRGLEKELNDRKETVAKKVQKILKENFNV